MLLIISFRYSTREFLCCIVPATVYECKPLSDQEHLSTCSDLLPHTTQRIIVWTMGIFAVAGNLMTISLHKKLEHGQNPVPSFFICNLAVADLLMGVYLFIIAVADAITHSYYAEHLEYWLRSPMCAIACFLTATSSVMSVFIMFIITVDRFLNIVFVLSKSKITMRVAIIIMSVAWLCSIVFVGIPSFASINQPASGRLYEYSSVCVPHNVTNPYYAIWIYFILAMSFCIWVTIVCLYSAAFLSLRNSRVRVRKKKSSINYEKNVAVRMFIIMITDLASWMPFYIILIGGATGSEIDVHFLPFIAVMILPLNSCINPILYTFSTAKFITRFIPQHSISSDANESSSKYKSKDNVSYRASNPELSSTNKSVKFQNLSHYLRKKASIEDATGISDDYENLGLSSCIKRNSVTNGIMKKSNKLYPSHSKISEESDSRNNRNVRFEDSSYTLPSQSETES